MYELKAIRDSRASFYGKALVSVEPTNGGNVRKQLFSYGTLVVDMFIDPKGEDVASVKVLGWFSATTARHINEFLLQNGAERAMSKGEMQTHAGIDFDMDILKQD